MDSTELYDVIVEGWERQEADNGIPYFVCHQTQTTSWDHPYFTKILEELDDYHEIRYAAYRTAMKIRHLQKRLSLHQITLKVIRSVLDDLDYPDGCHHQVTCGDLSTLLLGIYHTADHRQAPKQSPEVFADLLLNFLLNLFDISRNGSVSILSVKFALATLCSARLVEKYRFFYNELKDQSTFVGEKSLGDFIQDLIQIPDLLKESVAFGKNVPAVVASCLQGTSNTTGVPEDMFYSWLLREPQTLVWLPTLHRLAAAETVKHEAKCNICKSFPIIGFRYRCLKCFNFDICQLCFFTGQTRKNHKLKHPLQEYCLMTSSKEDTKAFMKTIRNNLSKKHRRKSKVKYLPIDSARINPIMEWSGRPGPQEPTMAKVTNTEAAGSQSNEPQPCTSRQPLAESNTFRPKSATVLVLNNTPRKTPTQSVHDKENVKDMSNFMKQQRQDYEGVIHRLEEENRKLYRKIAELRQPSDTESNLSYEADLEIENDVIHAQKDVLEDHNKRLSRHLNRVQNVLKQQPLHRSSSDITYHRPVSMSYLGHSYFSPLSIDTTPQACSSRIPSKHPTPAAGAYFTEPRRRKGKPLTPAGKEWHSSTTPGTPQWTGSTTPTTPDKDWRDPVTPKTPEWTSHGSIEESQCYFTPSSVSKSQFCPEEEAEIQELLKRIDDALPANLSFSAYSMGDSKSYNTNEEMLEAANNIGAAMSDFVHTTVDQYCPQ
ncbi:dystrophin-like [Haliotis cracherodii]|uniref:dystrophin-like n=1 Tax=Haliotis cracherodii TaxID=6455 RepID=UPI0039E81228